MSVSSKQFTYIEIKLSQINHDKNETSLFFHLKRKTKNFFILFYEFIES